ncbi:AAA family ATPase [Pseudomonas protegens]|uniref:AAA family ATPase n=1 Tax=Pseudomonas protegens TaxID=380021 RepID=UPI00287E5DD6|nr:AAA family ATPase [Pseudomonas protegens]MDS9874483.1 AAA family ATPase [Pseudomonas protegens]
MFTLFVFDGAGVRHSPGSVKIGEVGLVGGPGGPETPKGTRFPTLHDHFSQLDPSVHFSLGQDEDYYETLTSLSHGLGVTVLKALCDCAYDLEIFRRHKAEAVMSVSLLRSVHEPAVLNRLHRLAHGNPVLTKFEFQFIFPPAPRAENEIPSVPPTMNFNVTPNSEPPTNLHVLVGRNGVGKTRCIQSIINTILERDSDTAPRGHLMRLGENRDDWAFSRLVSVSFSAFDSFELPPVGQQRTAATFVGLRTQRPSDGKMIDELKTPDALAKDFVESLAVCRSGPRRDRWLRAIKTLSTDPLFQETGVETLVEYDFDWQDRAYRFFRLLSSGHAIVLLTATRLVELVDEQTLVVLDEPEGHLHPPLLSAFIRTVADLLVARNGFALISTHSPVVLQEVPRSCVWMLRRSRAQATVERPPIETFGESAGVLTRAVFGLEVTNSGFHQLVAAVSNQPGTSFEDVEQHFGGQLGAEAQALARGLVIRRNDP